MIILNQFIKEKLYNVIYKFCKNENTFICVPSLVF